MPTETSIHQRLKLLYLADILFKDTDENHMLSVYDIIELLEEREIHVNRKTLAEDIAMLTDFGMDIITEKSGRTNVFYLGHREFELPELKLLADAVSSARFITERKSRQLIKKLEALAGKFHGQELNRRVYIANRIKSENEQIYINIDVIQRAIDSRCMIKFRYFDYTLEKKKKFRSGERICSPYALSWNDGNYYLIAYYEKYSDSLSNFRVDRMSSVEILPDTSVADPDNFDLAGYMNTSFSMFSGTEYTVKLRFENRLINAVIDRFGTDIILMPDDDEHFTFTVQIKPGAAFYGWLFQFGTGAKILAPKELTTDFLKMMENVSEEYNTADN